MSTQSSSLHSMAGRTARESKRVRIVMASLYVIGAIVAVAFLLLFLAPAIGAHVVALAQVAVGSITGLAAIYTGSQAHTDAATAKALGNLAA